MCAGPLVRGRRTLSSLLAALPLILAGCVLGGDPAASDSLAAVSSDPVYAVAEAAIADDRPWDAEEALAVALADSARRSAELVLLSARAAASSSKWARVDSILAAEPWPDAETEARALEMRALAALERDEELVAERHARAAIAGARTAEQHGRFLAIRARALHRLGRRDSARVAYEESAILLPRIADWLYLRAAEVTRGADERADYYDLLRGEAAIDRAGKLEGQMLERAGAGRAAAAQYERIGSILPALRLRAATARGGAERASARHELVAYISEHSGRSEARAATEVLDAYFRTLPAADELTVAYSAAKTGPLSRARRGFSRAAAARRMDARARYTYGTVLSRSSRRSEALRQLALVKDPEWVGLAAFERARILLAQRKRSQAIAALRAILRKYPGDTAAASSALMLLGDIATDDRRESAARDAYETLAERYPTSELAPRALFQAGISQYAAGRLTVAARTLDTLVARHPEHEDAAGARYWSGRALLRLKDTVQAHERWRWLLENEPLSWYAAAGALRLGDGTTPWSPPLAAEEYRRYADLDSALSRATLLRKLGMSYEARLELDWLSRTAMSGDDVERMLSVANALRGAGERERSIELGRRAIAVARGRADARAYRFVYPIREGELIATEAAKRGVDPALVAAVIRQESGFNPRATSPVGARGMMQMMPRVARALARSEKITPWDPAMLYRPEINIRLGVAHLDAFVAHYDHPARALAAYNAGGSRVTRWSKRAGAKDPELFIERIRFDETRDYVRIVLRNRDMYRALYEW